MDATPISLSPELQNAIDVGGAPLRLWDDRSQKFYLLIEESNDSLDDDYLRRALQEATDDVTHGRVGPWDPEEIKREGRRILAERQAMRDP
jgi:hypothetical protein